MYPHLLPHLIAEPCRYDGQEGILLRNPVKPSASTLFIPSHLTPVLPLLNGKNHTETLCDLLCATPDSPIRKTSLQTLLKLLAQYHFLDPRISSPPSFTRGALQKPAPTTPRSPQAQFRAQRVRKARYERSYLGRGTTLQNNLTALLDLHVHSPPKPSLTGLIAPHVDLHRGHACYGFAYAALDRAPPADLYIIFGTSHQATHHFFVGTDKDFETPFGTLQTDQNLLHELAKVCGPSMFQDEFVHRDEHSIEFQTLFLAFLAKRRRTPPPKILPILCGAIGPFLHQQRAPNTDPAFQQFVATLQRLLAQYPGKVRCIAGVDLAHIGPQFGDPNGLDQAACKKLETRDRRTVELACQPNAEAFWNDVTADHNARKICGLGPIYALLHTLSPHLQSGEILHYDQTVDPAGNVVSFAAAALYT